MKILAVGGGSGGHVTPIVAVLNALDITDGRDDVRVWCDRKFYAQTKTLVDAIGSDIRVETIASGKFRRYHSMTWWQQLLKVRTIVLPNIIDGVKIIFGILQSTVKLLMWRPDVVFCKGGYVSLPVGVAAHLLRIPIVIHDSDVHPGLTNSILSRWASMIATGTPLANYTYPAAKSRYIGVPIDQRYREYTASERSAIKDKIGFDRNAPLVVITGGGLGAESINQAIVATLDRLVAKTQVLLISGEKNFADIDTATRRYQDQGHFQLHGFVDEAMTDVMAAADVVVSRAGATTLLELAALHKPTILVPNPYLTGGHQTKNAQTYASKNAAIIVDEAKLESEPELLADTILSLVGHQENQRRLAKSIAGFAHPEAAKELAAMIRSVGSDAK